MPLPFSVDSTELTVAQDSSSNIKNAFGGNSNELGVPVGTTSGLVNYAANFTQGSVPDLNITPPSVLPTGFPPSVPSLSLPTIPNFPGTAGSSIVGPIKDAMIIDLLAVADKARRKDVPDRIYFTYMPDQFRESKSAEYANINVLGRSEPILGYSHSSPRVFQIPLVFACTGRPVCGIGNSVMFEGGNPFKEVIFPVWLMRSWVYPDYTSQTKLPNVPPRVLLVVGKWLSQRCVVTRCEVTYFAPWGRAPASTLADMGGFVGDLTGANPFTSDSLLPYIAKVDLVMQEVTENTSYTPWGCTQVSSGEDRGSGWF